MSFWSFIGLASKNDIEILNQQLKDMKNLVVTNISINDSINNTSIQIKQNIDNGIDGVNCKIDDLNLNFDEKITELNNKNMETQEIISNKVNDISLNINKLNEKTKECLVELMYKINEVYKDTGEIGSNIKNIESIISKNKVINEITNNIKKSQNKLNSLTKEIDAIQEMIRIVWVNDIADTLEKQASKIK